MPKRIAINEMIRVILKIFMTVLFNGDAQPTRERVGA